MSEGADWLDQARRLAAGLGQAWAETGAAAEGETPGHEPGGDCRWCPLCRAAAVARRPDVSEALADLLTSAAGALRSGAAPSAPPAPEPAPTPEPEPAQVQHIELG
ncbi:hypothetical protein ACI8AV_20205 [Geodermatophilus sp. SYSU D00804]